MSKRDKFTVWSFGREKRQWTLAAPSPRSVSMEQESVGEGTEGVRNEFWSRARMVIKPNKSTHDYLKSLKTKVGAALADRKSPLNKEMSEGRKFCEGMHAQWTKYLHEEIVLLKIERQNEMLSQEQAQMRWRYVASVQNLSATLGGISPGSSKVEISTAEAERPRTPFSASQLDVQTLRLNRVVSKASEDSPPKVHGPRTLSPASPLDSQMVRLNHGVYRISQDSPPALHEPASLDELPGRLQQSMKLAPPASGTAASKRSGTGKKRVQKYLKGMPVSFGALQHQTSPPFRIRSSNVGFSPTSPVGASPTSPVGVSTTSVAGECSSLNEQKRETTPSAREVIMTSVNHQAASQKRPKKPKFSELQQSTPTSLPTPAKIDHQMQDSTASCTSDGRREGIDWAMWTVNGGGVAPRVTLAAADVAATGGKKIKKAWERMRTMVIKKHDKDSMCQMESGNPLAQVAKNGDLEKPDRGACWIALACSDTTDVMSRLRYTDLVSQPCHLEREIVRDVHRTFPQHEMFQEEGGAGQTALFNIIKAYANLDEEVGYCQGMAALVAMLLMHMKEEDAFFCMVFLMYRCGLRGLFISNMEQLQVRLLQLSQLIVDHMPTLHSHMESLNVKPVMYAAPWFLTLFATSLPQYLVDRVFDIVFAERTHAIVFKLALVLLQVCMRQLLQCTELEHFMHFLRHELQNELRSTSEADMEELIDKALRVGLPFENLLKLEAEYELLEEKAALAANEVSAAVAANKTAAARARESNRSQLEMRLRNALAAKQGAEKRVEALSQKLSNLSQEGMENVRAQVSELDVAELRGEDVVDKTVTQQLVQPGNSIHSSIANLYIRRTGQKIEKLGSPPEQEEGADCSTSTANDLVSAVQRAQQYSRVSSAAADVGASVTAVGTESPGSCPALPDTRDGNARGVCYGDGFSSNSSVNAGKKQDDANGSSSSNQPVRRESGHRGFVNSLRFGRGLHGTGTITNSVAAGDSRPPYRQIPAGAAAGARTSVEEDGHSTLCQNRSKNGCAAPEEEDELSATKLSAQEGMGEGRDGVSGQQQERTLGMKLDWREAPTFFARSVRWLRSERSIVQQVPRAGDQMRMEPIQPDLVEGIFVHDRGII